MEHLGQYINYLFDVDEGARRGLLDRFTSLSEQTKTKDIDRDRIYVVEINKTGDAYNIKKKYENNIFWYIYESSDKVRRIPLIASYFFFAMGFALLGVIFFKNMMLVISNI